MNQETLAVLGAALAVFLFVTSILVFAFRLAGKPAWAHWIGYLEIAVILPLVYLLFQFQRFDRPALYAIQVGFMIAWLVVELLLDYVLKVDFRQNMRVVIAYVVLFFAGMGGMLGVASRAGTAWTVAAVILFLVMAVLTFVQRAVTGK